ncbi:DUF4038 domain-containing protein [Isoptericola sp. NPDC056605]|uniref:apiosidase-like domain-containing protein n=1 Tax=Isoptericola sp. NPDC056605 TaxID=3345876 RepID=UPI00369A1D86
MARETSHGRRRRVVAVVATTAVVALAVAGAAWWWDREHQGQASRIGGTAGPVAAELPATPPTAPETPDGAHLVTGVGPDGRYFVDQDGAPVLVRGDSPWSLLVDLSPEEALTYLDDRQGRAVNALIVSLLGATANGGPSDDGATADGLLPFVDGDVLSWVPEYWDRAHATLAAAAERGMSVFLYPVDGWTVGRAFSPSSQQECRIYGERVGTWAADLPGVVWMTGGDYFPAADDPAAGSDVDRCFDQVVQGIRDTGDHRPFSIQLGYPRSVTTDDPYWASRVDFTFVYSYPPAYDAVRQAYDREPAVPALFAEGGYEGENNDGGPPTSPESLRRQAAWALTSGSPGDFYGSDDWEFLDGWQGRLDAPGLRQVGVVRDVVEALPWWELHPSDDLVVSGAGAARTGDTTDVLDGNRATAAATADGRAAVVYVPTERVLGLDLAVLASAGRARWVDPSSGAATPVALTERMRTPGRNADGAGDWLLVIGPG